MTTSKLGRGTDRPLLLTGGRIYGMPQASTSLLVVDGRIAWIGDDADVVQLRPAHAISVDLAGSLVTPGFVDAHIHATSTGLLLDGLDLTHIRDKQSLLAAVTEFSRRTQDDVILGHGWDETTWTGDSSSRAVPTRAELDQASDGKAMYLSRIDVHSALVTSSLVAKMPTAQSADGYDDCGPVARESHHLLRAQALGSISAHQRGRAQARLLCHAAERGIVSVHENAGPTISSEEDLSDLLELSRSMPSPLVIGYWAQLSTDGGIDRAKSIGAHGVAGDLFVDGAIGSRTACLCEPYLDASRTQGARYLDAEAIACHVVDATNAGMQAGFHVIGDAACETVIQGFVQAESLVGQERLRMASHRLEHAEMLADEHLRIMKRLGIIASMQPMFDALWGGPGGMYEQRLGRHRSEHMNRFADIDNAGVALAFSSDAPVTPMDPWQAVRAAVHHNTDSQRIRLSRAFEAHTSGGWAAMGDTATGRIEVGAPAHLAVWNVDGFDMVDGLPMPTTRTARPECLATVVAGGPVYASDQLVGLEVMA